MSVESLGVYQKSYQLALEIHSITRGFPSQEQVAGIADQLRRSSKSIPANIVEGYAKRQFYPAEFKRYLVTALGSCDESILWLKMSQDLQMLDSPRAKALIERFQEVGKMIYGFIKSAHS
jgi:four helix bundle protein